MRSARNHWTHYDTWKVRKILRVVFMVSIQGITPHQPGSNLQLWSSNVISWNDTQLQKYQCHMLIDSVYSYVFLGNLSFPSITSNTVVICVGTFHNMLTVRQNLPRVFEAGSAVPHSRGSVLLLYFRVAANKQHSQFPTGTFLHNNHFLAFPVKRHVLYKTTHATLSQIMLDLLSLTKKTNQMSHSPEGYT